jgi:hypothetical protein
MLICAEQATLPLKGHAIRQSQSLTLLLIAMTSTITLLV